MSSIHHLPREEVESKVIPENGDQIVDSIEDIDSNGKAFGHWFESFHIFADNSVVIASDTLRGLQFNGYITKFERIEDVPQLPVLSLNLSFGGICDLIALRDKKKMICGFDSGHISLLNEELEEQMSVIYHDSLITRINTNSLETRIVSCGYDMSIVVIDLETFNHMKWFVCAHSATIWDTEFAPFDDNLLLSCSRDKDVLIWDLRKPKPASKVTTLASEPSAINWSRKDISNAYIGTDSGQLLLFDIRNPTQEVKAITSSGHRIYRIKNVFSGNGISICADDNVFKVFDSELVNCVYEDKTSHSDWVRAVTEHNKLLYTVGRDSRLVCHSQLNTFT